MAPSLEELDSSFMDVQDGSDDEAPASDNEDDEHPHASGSQHSLRLLQQKLCAERRSREETEAELAELRASFARLKRFALEAVQQRDHAMSFKREAEICQQDLLRRIDEASQARNEAIRQRDEAFRLKDDAIRSRDEVSLLKDVAMRARNSNKADVESATRLLVAAADGIAEKVSSFRIFPENLPRSSSHAGIVAIVHGFTTRAEEVVDELLRQLDIASKDKFSLQEQVEEQRQNFTVKILELEASIQMLKENLIVQATELEKWQATTDKADQKFFEFEQMVSEKLIVGEKQKLEIENALHSKETLLQNVETWINELSELLFETHETIAKYAITFFPKDSLENFSPLFPSSDEVQDKMNCCTTRVKENLQLFLKLAVTWNEQVDLRKKALEDLEGTVTRLIVEKNEITRFLESALAIKQQLLEAVSKISLENDNNVNTITKEKEAGSDNDELLVGELGSSNSDLITGMLSNKVSVLETELKKSRLKTFELQQFLAAASGELEVLKVTSERQAKELLDKAVTIQDLRSEQCFMQKTIEGLKSKVAAAGDDVLEAKKAFQTEAEARLLSVEEANQLKEQVSFLKEQVYRLNDSVNESTNKLFLKEKMASAAVAARKAAEHSLFKADERAIQLRKKIDDMVRQFELLERKEDGVSLVNWYNACWPYQWLRGRHSYSSDKSTWQTGAEMDKLLESFV